MIMKCRRRRIRIGKGTNCKEGSLPNADTVKSIMKDLLLVPARPDQR